MEIRKADLKEVKQTAYLFNKYRMFYGQQSDITGAVAFINERIERNESVIFLAVEEQSPIGFIQLYPIFTSVGMKRKWLLNDLYVTEEFRRKGIAKALMMKAKEHAINTQAAGILLETGKENTGAQALYEGLGYQKENGVYFYNLSF